MQQTASNTDRFNKVQTFLNEIHQDHLLQWWNELSSKQQESLIDEIESVDWARVVPLIETHVKNKPVLAELDNLEPADMWTAESDETDDDTRKKYEQAHQTGTELIRSGKVAALTVAGGQGSRLGYDGPKGCVEVSPAGNKSLFAIFASMIKAASERYHTKIQWYIMTSAANHEQTVSYFEKHNYFSLEQSQVHFFSQGMLPAFDNDGRALLADKHQVALAPDGHGGTLMALRKSGCLKDMQEKGINTISYFQVDNPLVKPFDSLFLVFIVHINLSYQRR